MKIVIPVTTHDVARLPKVIKAFVHFGGLIDHDLVILHSPSCAEAAKESADEIRSHVASVVCTQTPYEFTFGLFTDVNMLFVAAVRYLANSGNKDSFLWYELDARPNDYGWVNTLLKEYKQKGRACMGSVVDLPRINGGVLETVTGDKMMMAVGIYPPGLEAHPETAPLIADLGKPPPRNPEQPFDVYLRGALRRVGMAHTDLISDQWNTGNYRHTPDGIMCDARPFPRQVRNRGGLVAKEAVLIHGCKDDSLDLLLFPAPDVVKPVSPATPQAATSPASDVGRLNSIPAEVVASGEPSGLKELVEAKLAKGSVRLNVLATELKTDNKTLTENLKSAGFAVSVPAGWIKAA